MKKNEQSYHYNCHLLVVSRQCNDPVNDSSLFHLPGGSLSQKATQRFRLAFTANPEDNEMYAIFEDDLQRLHPISEQYAADSSSRGISD